MKAKAGLAGPLAGPEGLGVPEPLDAAEGMDMRGASLSPWAAALSASGLAASPVLLRSALSLMTTCAAMLPTR